MDMFDFNTAETQRDPTELIPNGTVALILLKIRPHGQGPGGFLKTAGDRGQMLMADCEFTIVGGPFNKRKFWNNYVVEATADATEGQKKATEISRGAFRGMLESARGILPTADDAESMAKRRVKGWGDFDGLVFCGKIGIEQGELKDGQPPNGERYPDKNKLTCAITPDHKAYVSPGNADAVAILAANAASSTGSSSGGAQQAAAGVEKPAWAQ